mmetsp:Transcript_3560/g.4663  ORF Transcript_3560/g.4663 Transcript_3560/m.4663 type:complete len:553 (-) Transcript_3560:205-1863(-)
MQVFIFFLTAMAAIGGFLFGYDTGVISGAMIRIREDFHLTPIQQEVVVSITVAGAIFGAMMGGPLNQRRGRRPTIILSSVIFASGSLILGGAVNYAMMVFARLIVGLGIGMASLTTPIYIAEAAPSEYRGMLVTLNTLFITAGQFCAGMVDGVLSTVPQGWRWMLGLGALPAFLQLFGFIFLPESPRWLVRNHRKVEAAEVLEQIRGCQGNFAAIEAELENIQHSADMEEECSKGKVTFRSLFQDPVVRKALILGCGIQALQQFIGINTVMYYAASIYSMAGFGDVESIWLSGFTALAQVIGVALGVVLIERMGRRTLVLISLGFVTASLLVLGAGFYLARHASTKVIGSATTNSLQCSFVENIFWGEQSVDSCYTCVQLEGCGFCNKGNFGFCMDNSASETNCVADDWEATACENKCAWIAVISMVFYLAFFGIGMSSIPWTLNSEIYPLYARSLATSLSTSVNWVGNVIVSASFLTIASPQVLSQDGAFWLYASIGVGGWIWLYKTMPETKGLALEDIVSLFDDAKRRPLKQMEESGTFYTAVNNSTASL